MHQPHGDESLLARVVNLDHAQVVPAGGNLQRVLVPRLPLCIHVHQVAQEEGGALLLYRVGKVAQRGAYVGAIRTRLEFQHLAYDVKEMGAAFCRRDELLHLVGEEEHTHLVVVEYGAVCEYGSDFGYALALVLHPGTEQAGAAHVHEQHHGEFPFLLEHLHIRGTQTGSDVPVHRAHVVSPLVLAHLAECHTTPLEGRMVLTRKDLVGESFRPYFDLPDLF